MLYGRAAEIATIEEMLDRAATGRSGATVLRGEAGIGKSALLDHAAEAAAARGFLVLRAQGVEAESELSFAGLHLLLGRAADDGHLDALPDTQARALRAALGRGRRGEESAPNPFFIGLGALSLLSELSADRPVLCLLDDAHWLDRATTETLLFATRRLDAEGIVMLFAARSGNAPAFPAPGVPEMPLDGLADDDAIALLTEDSTRLPEPDLRRVLAEARGNPLALRILPRLPMAARDHAGIQRAFADQIAALPQPTRTLLLVAAADDTAELPVVLAAATRFGDTTQADLGPAESKGLLQVDDGRITFPHPLVRTAAYRSATTAERARAHLALADALADLSGDVHADRRAWHLAAAATGPTERAASALERTAERALVRGGHVAVADAYRRAAELSPDPVERGRRLAAAARIAADAGHLDEASRLADEAVPFLTDPLARARLTSLQARIADERDQSRLAFTLLDNAVTSLLGTPAGKTTTPTPSTTTDEATSTAAGDNTADTTPTADGNNATHAVPTADSDNTTPAAPTAGGVNTAQAAPTVVGVDMTRGEVAGRLLFQAAEAAWGAGDLGAVAGVAERAAALGVPGAGRLKAFVRIVGALNPGSDLRAADGLLALRTLLAGLDPGRLPERAKIAFWQMLLGDVATARDLAAALERDCRREGALGVLSRALATRATTERLLGHHAEARTAATEGRELAGCLGQRGIEVYQTTTLAILAAIEGDAEGCNELAAVALARDIAPSNVHAVTALSLLDLALGRPDAALDRLVTTFDGANRQGATGAIPDLVEAAHRTGRLDLARERFAWFGTWAEHVDRPWAYALSHRCQALMTADDAETHFTTALALHHASGAHAFDRARTQLLYGEWLRREQRRGDARSQLRAALETFHHLAARPWADRAALELRATGENRMPTDGLLLDRLTPQELQVVRLAATGLSNRDIAARLFLSPRTVGYHLSNAYPKLGVTSRRDLVKLAPAMDTR